MDKKNNLKNQLSIFDSGQSIEIQSITYILNLTIPTFILLISSIFKDFILTAELGIVIGINIILTQIFSSNSRSILISKKNNFLIRDIFVYRIFVSIIIIFCNVFIYSIFNFENNILLYQISLIILLQWINEIILTYHEINKKLKVFIFFLVPSLVFILMIICDYYFFNNLNYIFYAYILFLVIFLIINSINLIFLKKNIHYKNIINLIFVNNSFYSSFSVSSANIVWRLSIYNFCEKTFAGILFASFAVGSLPGTIFNNSFGPTIVKDKISMKRISKRYLFGIFFSLNFVLFFITLINKDKIFDDPLITQIFVTSISIFASIFMIYGQYARQVLIHSKFQNITFKIDVIYSFIIASIVPLLYLLGSEKIVSISFIVSSFSSFIIYNIVKNKLKI